MKKEYTSPSTSVIVIDCAGMLCTSTDTPNFDTSDMESLPVSGDSWDGTAL